MSPKKLYNILLFCIYRNFGHSEKDLFEFWFRGDLPSELLESRDPLKWFCCLEHRAKLSWDNVATLVDFLEEASRDDLVSKAKDYQTKIRIVKFLQKHLQANLPEVNLGKIFATVVMLFFHLPLLNILHSYIRFINSLTP